jgi:hypothetical protein
MELGARGHAGKEEGHRVGKGQLAPRPAELGGERREDTAMLTIAPNAMPTITAQAPTTTQA